MSQLSKILHRAEDDLRTISKALAVAGFHADALRFLGYAALVANDVPEKLAAGEVTLQREASLIVPAIEVMSDDEVPTVISAIRKKCG